MPHNLGMDVDVVYIWACRNCGDYGQVTFVIDRCRSCDRLITLENISKPRHRSDGIKKEPKFPVKTKFKVKIGTDVSG